jgi:hypothetical protein
LRKLIAEDKFPFSPRLKPLKVGIGEVRPMKRLLLMSILTMLPTVALAQSQVSKLDCAAYQKNLDRLWTVTRENVMIVNGKSISINMTMACCFGSESKRLILGGVNIIKIVEKFCF